MRQVSIKEPYPLRSFVVVLPRAAMSGHISSAPSGG